MLAVLGTSHTGKKMNNPPIVVCCGVGVDSVAMLVGLHARSVRPDLILFADVGAEREGTYEFIPVLREWLQRVGFPDLTIVRYVPKDFKHWPPYHTIEENLFTNSTLPSIAYGGHSCSKKWKIDPQNKYIKQWPPAIEAWAKGQKVIKYVGFDAGARDSKRATKQCGTFAIQADEYLLYSIEFPLQLWGWDRERCKAEIAAAGMPVPPKSSCYFCTAMKTWEVDELSKAKLRRIVMIEARAAQRNLDAAMERGWPNGVGVPLTEGLWRRRVKGMRGAIAKPGSMTEYIREKGLLPAEEVDALKSLTPTKPMSKDDVDNWQKWIEGITMLAAS